jgi:hypothetical protein
MNAEQAVAAAQAAAPGFGIPPNYGVRSAELRIVEVVADAPVVDALPPPGPVMDRRAWVVNFGVDILWAELAIDDLTGQVLRLRRSRTAAAHWDEGSLRHG